MLEAAAGRARDAAVIYGAAEAMLESVGATGQATVTRVQDRYLTLARDAIGEGQFRAAVARGRVIPVQRVVDMVLSARAEDRIVSGPPPLSMMALPDRCNCLSHNALVACDVE